MGAPGGVKFVQKLSNESCVFNRGVFVVDLERWRQLHIVQDIEQWMQLYSQSKADLYRFGMSQPPWLLALTGRYARVTGEWNCRGLGRQMMDPDEVKLLKRCGWFDKVTV